MFKSTVSCIVMKVTHRATCYRCKAPLRISFFTNGMDTDWLYTWLEHEPLDLSMNIIMYKKVGNKMKHCCPMCYKMAYGPLMHMDRESGLSWTGPLRPYMREEIVDWLQRGREYCKSAPREIAPLTITSLYWLLVPGLYLWYRPLVFQTSLLQYANLDIQLILL
jgi:hypothetical protein